eukprot:2889915-Rhodomonas_salina.1
MAVAALSDMLGTNWAVGLQRVAEAHRAGLQRDEGVERRVTNGRVWSIDERRRGPGCRASSVEPQKWGRPVSDSSWCRGQAEAQRAGLPGAAEAQRAG